MISTLLLAGSSFTGWKCAQVLSSRAEENVSAEEHLDPLLENCRSKVAILQERLLHQKAQNDEQISDSATLEVRLGA